MRDNGVGCTTGRKSLDSPSRPVNISVGACPLNHRCNNPSFQTTAQMLSSFRAFYYGEAVLDRRHTPAMLRWIVADIRRTAERGIIRRVQLALVGSTSLKVFEIGSAGETLLFEHRLQALTRLSRVLHEPGFFSYLTRSDNDAPFTCHVFLAVEETDVQLLFDAVHEAGSPSVVGGTSAVSPASISHRFYEVLYVGKVIVSTKKAPPTFIDDAVSKFENCNSELSVRNDSRTIRDELCEGEKEITKAKAIYNAFNNTNLNRASSSGSEDAFLADGAPFARPRSFGDSKELDNLRRSSHDSLFDRDETRSSKSSYDMEKPRDKVGDDVGGVRLQEQSHVLSKAASSASSSSSSEDHRNRTMLIQVCDSELSLISLDRKSVIFERQFKDISFCSQGITHPEHFGFISREPESANLTCYVFRCAAESVVEEIMLTLKQAFQSAFKQNANKILDICELCPMHQLHRLCQQLEKLDSDQTRDVLQQRLSQLNEADQQEIGSFIRNCGRTLSVIESNEVVVSALLRMSKRKQQEHVHLGDIGLSPHGKYDFILSTTQRSESDALSILSQRSFGSSLEHPFKESVGGEAQQQMKCSITVVKSMLEESGIGLTDSMKNTASKNSIKGGPFLRPTSPGKPLLGVAEQRPRRNSAPHQASSGFCSSPLLNDANATDKSPLGDTTSCTPIPRNSPMRSMFAKVGNNDPTEPNGPPPDLVVGGKFGGNPVVRSVSASVTPLQPNRQKNTGQRSWRLGILNSVVSDAGQTGAGRSGTSIGDPFGHVHVGKIKSPLSSEKMHALWQKAILETLLLIRMNKENKANVSSRSQAGRTTASATSERHQSTINYEEITPCLKEVTKIWERLLKTEDRSTTQIDIRTLTNAVKDGVPRAMRGEIWQLLVEQNTLDRHVGNNRPRETEEVVDQYQDLLRKLTLHQHAILIDLGRTFPGHPYFSAQLGPGQLSLFNLLKAYSLLDDEVGYCQGLSFVAGILLMHVNEQKAFHLMKYLMFNLSFRRQYRPDMVSLQIQMYQLSRLLHDLHKDLYDHFETNEIAPTLYAAPWFLTIFASQFPIGFVSRVFDLIFLEGTDVVLKVSLALLANHKELIKQCLGFESVVEFLKTTLPEMGFIQMERVINEVFAMNIAKQLEAYEVEYHVLQEEMNSLHAMSDRKGSADLNSNSIDSSGIPDRVVHLQVANDALRQQKIELLEQLQIARRHIHSLEEQNQVFADNDRRLISRIRSLEIERKALLEAVAALQKQNSPGSSSEQPWSDNDHHQACDMEVAKLTLDMPRTAGGL